MSDRQAMVRLFEYCEWANHRFLDAVAALPAGDYLRDLKGSHGGVHGTLLHTYGAEWVWQQRFGGVSPSALPGQEQITDLATLRGRGRRSRPSAARGSSRSTPPPGSA